MRSHPVVTIAFTLCALCALPSVSLAGGAGVEFGFQAGLDLARTAYDPPAELFQPTTLDNDFRTVFGGGATISFTFTAPGSLSLESGLLLHMKGGKTRMTDQEYDWVQQKSYELKWNITWKFLYLSVPILARVSIPAGRLKPYLKAGAAIDILLSAEWNTESTSPYGKITAEEDIKDDTTPFDIGLIAGAGVELPLARVSPFVEVTYCHGLIDIIDPENTKYNVKGHNRVIGVMTGVRF